MREIEILREALTALKTMAEAAAGRKIYVPAIEALATLETEIARLRECALDLSGVPEGYRFDGLMYLSEEDCYRVLLLRVGFFLWIEGYGPTPRAALENAIGRVKA